jgi:hypothetical protein
MDDDANDEPEIPEEFPEGIQPDEPDPYDLKSIKWGWQPHSDISLARINVRRAMDEGTLNLPKTDPQDTGMGTPVFQDTVWSNRPRERAKQEAEGKPYQVSLYERDGWHCTCDAYKFRRWQKCSHVLAVEEKWQLMQRQLPPPKTAPAPDSGILVDEDGEEYFLNAFGSKVFVRPVWDRKWNGDYKAYYASLIENSWEYLKAQQWDRTLGGKIYDFRRDSPLRVTTGPSYDTTDTDAFPLAPSSEIDV